MITVQSHHLTRPRHIGRRLLVVVGIAAALAAGARAIVRSRTIHGPAIRSMSVAGCANSNSAR
mgnify:CR=1 FL=1